MFWLNLRWVGNDLRNSLEDGGTGWDYVVASDGGVPIAAVLELINT